MESHEDSIVDISKTLEKFFGCSGKMLKPSRATMEALINEIPSHKLATIQILRKELARRHNVQVTCPYDTRMVLQSIAKDPDTKVEIWRVLKTNGELNARYPDGLAGHAARLKAEGFSIDTGGKVPRVKNFKQSLVSFE